MRIVNDGVCALVYRDAHSPFTFPIVMDFEEFVDALLDFAFIGQSIEASQVICVKARVAFIFDTFCRDIADVGGSR